MLKAQMKVIVFCTIILTTLVNLLFFGYILYYEIGGYRELNNNIIQNFNGSIAQNDWDKVDYNDLCFSLEPKNFLTIYHSLEFYSLLMIKILAVVLIIFFIVCRKELSKKTITKLSLILIAFLAFNFILSIYEADYEFVFPCMNSGFYSLTEKPI